MADNATIRLNKVLRELNISLDRAVDYLAAKGFQVEARPTTKISDEVYEVLLAEFRTDKSRKVASKEIGEEKRKEKAAGADAMTRKLVNDSAAYLRALAQMRGRNADWADRAVREGASLSATEAEAGRVIDFIAADLATAAGLAPQGSPRP